MKVPISSTVTPARGLAVIGLIPSLAQSTCGIEDVTLYSSHTEINFE
jgi:hypothetical protein